MLQPNHKKSLLKRFIIISLMMITTPAALMANQAKLTNVRINHLKHGLQYVVDLTQMVPVTDHTYHHPYRKVYSFYHVTSALTLSKHFGSNAYVHAVKLQHGHDRVSVGLHLAKAYPVSSVYWAPNKAHRYRYVITIATSKASYQSTHNSVMNFNRSKAMAQINKHIGPEVNHFIKQHLPTTTSNKTSYQHLYASKHHTKPTSSLKHYVDQALSQKSTYQQPMAKPISVKKPTPVKVVPASQAETKHTDDLGATAIDLPIAPTPGTSAKRYSSKVIVVIDPGHGGKDPGATGPSGYHEKKVVLEISKKLQKEINSYPGFKAVLTRGDDRYLSLRYRLTLAREYHGDMFVAIHADAFINSTAHGASVFALSQRGATSEAARWLAERENQSELMGGVNLSNKDRTLRSVLIDLSQTATIGASLKIGSGIITQLRPIVPLHAGHVEQAAFVVLKSPDIPSLLVETGFISNPTEEQLLIRHSHQQKLAKAMARGIVNYFSAHPPRGSWLAAQHQDNYVVQANDTIASIARRFNISISQLVAINHLRHTNIYIGQKLKVSP